MKKIQFIIFIGFLIVLPQVSEASHNFAADYLVEIGELSYEKGDIEDAVHEFSKALILDPDHEGALRHLQALGYSRGLYGQSSTSADQILELSREVDSYREILNSVESQRREINAQLNQLTAKHEEVVQDHRSKEEELKAVQARIERMGDDLGRLEQERISTAAEQSRLLFNTQIQQPVVLPQPSRSYVADVEYSDFGDTSSVRMNQKLMETMDLALLHQEQSLALSRENRDLEKEIRTSQSDRQNMVEVMEDYLYIQHAKMTDFSNQAVISDLERIEKHRQLKETADALADTGDLLVGVMRKADEREAVIQQKNMQITDLQKRLEWYQKSFENPSNPEL